MDPRREGNSEMVVAAPSSATETLPLQRCCCVRHFSDFRPRWGPRQAHLLLLLKLKLKLPLLLCRRSCCSFPCCACCGLKIASFPETAKSRSPTVYNLLGPLHTRARAHSCRRALRLPGE